MNVRDELDLVADWWEYWRRFSGTRQERKDLSLGEPANVVRAADQVRDVIDDGGHPAVDLITKLIAGGTQCRRFDHRRSWATRRSHEFARGRRSR